MKMNFVIAVKQHYRGRVIMRELSDAVNSGVKQCSENEISFKNGYRIFLVDEANEYYLRGLGMETTFVTESLYSELIHRPKKENEVSDGNSR